MTTIDEEDEVMDFVNWDAAGADTGFDFDTSPQGASSNSNQPDDANMDLVLGDVDGDDWSYWALEHFDSLQMPQEISLPVLDETLLPVEDEAPLPQMYWENPDSPCAHCRRGGYQCKRIKEGQYKGYCTSCVALRCECSFGPVGNHAGAEVGQTFPANPWPIMGDRPATSILHEDDIAATINPVLDSQQSHVDPDSGSKVPSPKGPKIGARFSRESVRILKNWVSTHSRHPYPTEDEKESLQRITGLNKTQITNWLANARRRGKIQPTRSTSPHIGNGYIQAIDIPQRRGTPSPTSFQMMNPLQRWENSPPENEPASVTAIARAVASNSAVSSSSGRNSPYISGYSDDGSGKSLCNQSSASSFTNSHGSSGGSWASSHQSRGSFGSIPSFARSNRGRRRRRRAPAPRAQDGFQQPLKTFQCTFCTETFRTKHDWQRHEKSLHLSLERWVCSPDGAKCHNPETNLTSCVFCGEANPDNLHIEAHNFSGCTERTAEERTFYRKDHLRQHLKLVHNVKFLPWSMEKWRVSSPQIRSRCGFCGIVMDSWSIRVDHLAEHFKTGNTMADWKGDWGFETPVLEMVENSIPPYLIHDERNTPFPYMASAGNPATPNNAYELIKLELEYWAHNFVQDSGHPPSDDEVRQEACRIIFGAEVISQNPSHQAPSWLRDLILSKETVAKSALHQPIRKQAENRLSSLRINGKDNVFEQCEVERQLREFVRARELLGLTAMDHELQVEACKIIGRMEEKSSCPSEDVANWLVRLIHSCPEWLTDFRKRNHLPRSEDIVNVDERSTNLLLIDSTIHNYSRLERELGEFLQSQRAMGLEPSDALLQQQARNIIYESDDNWNQTAADDSEWLIGFKRRHPKLTAKSTVSPSGSSPNSLPSAQSQLSALSTGLSAGADNASLPKGWAKSARAMRPGPFFLNDANCYMRLAKNLARFVQSTMSPNNPNFHVPTDEELQHQARWIVYDEDDPWNQTAADNAEWLLRFKRDTGILPAESGPGLTMKSVNWDIPSGGTGFAPPYLCPNPQATIEPFTKESTIFCREDNKPFNSDVSMANAFLQTFQQRYPAPAKIFCSRELEKGLTEYVKREMSLSGGVFPSDDQLRARAREIMGMQKTPADDAELLVKFKDSIRGVAGVALPSAMAIPNPLPDVTTGLEQTELFPAGMEMTLTDEQVGDIIDDLSRDLSNENLLNLGQ